MNILCLKTSLVKGINIITKAVASRSTTPILECCLLVAKNNNLTLKAYDLEIAIQTTPIEADVLEEGSIAIEAKTLFDIVKRVPQEKLEIIVDDKNLVTIKSGTSEFKILGYDGSEFPELPEITKDEPYKIPATQLKDMIKQTIFSISKDDTRPQLRGGLLEIKDNSLRLVCVDGFRISYRHFPFIHNSNAKTIIPEKTLKEISQILPDENDNFVDIYISDRHILLETSECIIISSLIEGEFLNYEGMFTRESTTTITINKNPFIDCIERATTISKDAKKNPIRLNIENGNIIVTSNTEIGSSYEEIEAEQDGPALEIGFNPRYIIDALRVIEGDTVNMFFTTSLSPCIIQEPEGQEFKYLVLPLRIR